MTVVRLTVLTVSVMTVSEVRGTVGTVIVEEVSMNWIGRRSVTELEVSISSSSVTLPVL